MELRGRVAVVTGAAQGIGRGIAMELAAVGCHVVVADLLDRADVAAAARRTVDALRAEGVEARAVACDVRDLGQCEHAMATAADELGSVDIVVANAGIMRVGGVADLTAAEWQQTIDVNLTGAFNTCKAALPHLERTKGAIVAIASTEGFRNDGTRTAYSSSKFGVVGLTEGLASECLPLGIRVNGIAPAFVRSALSVGELMDVMGIDDPVAADEAWTQAGAVMGPLGRSVEPEDIGRAVVWLCEADMVTGAMVPVTGGFTLPAARAMRERG